MFFLSNLSRLFCEICKVEKGKQKRYYDTNEIYDYAKESRL